MGGAAGIKIAMMVFFVWLSSQMGSMVEEVLGRVRVSIQASELMTLDGHLAVWAIEQRRTRPPDDQAEFEKACNIMLSVRGRSVTQDRWREDYIYERVRRTPVHWRVTSKGPDRIYGTEDDISVERIGDMVELNTDPVAVIEQAIARKRKLDAQVLRRLRTLVKHIEQGTDKKDPHANGKGQDDSIFGDGSDLPPGFEKQLEKQQKLIEESLQELDDLLAQSSDE